jgi:hypothetical protein
MTSHGSARECESHTAPESQSYLLRGRSPRQRSGRNPFTVDTGQCIKHRKFIRHAPFSMTVHDVTRRFYWASQF